MRTQRDFSRLLEILLPDGGCALAMIEAYFDESYEGEPKKRTPILCVAGYVMGDDRARQMDAEWRAVLTRYSLPFFRMSACAHGSSPFDRLSPDECIEVEREMLDIIRRHASLGVGATINMNEYAQLMPAHPMLGSDYSFCANFCLTATVANVEEFGAAGDIGYFFESGHRSQGEANRLMAEIFQNEDQRRAFRYGGHAFLPKEKTPALQAADLLAWQIFTYRKNQISGERPMRKDFQALCKGTLHKITHMTAERIEDTRDRMMRDGLWSPRDPFMAH